MSPSFDAATSRLTAVAAAASSCRVTNPFSAYLLPPQHAYCRIPSGGPDRSDDASDAFRFLKRRVLGCRRTTRLTCGDGGLYRPHPGADSASPDELDNVTDADRP